MRTAVYARVSTSDQNCDLQLRELREYCQRRGWEPVADTVVNGINNLGQIVGTVGDKTGFLYTNGVFTMIEAPATAFTPEPNSYTLILGGVSLLLLRQKIVELRAAGMSFGKIASKFNISKTSVVRRTKTAC